MRRVERSVILATVGLASLWLILATRDPTTTFHLGPVMVAGFAPVATSGNRATAAGLAVGLAVLVSLILVVGGRLEGPSLLPWGDAAVETSVGIAVGGLAGILTGRALERSHMS